MNTLLIFVWIYAAMIAMAFWESYVEGRNPWHNRKLGWKINITKKYVFHGYHFFLFFVMWPLLLTLPFIIYGFEPRLFGVLVSAFFSGMVLEDFMWYIVNPAVKFKEFNSKFANYYPWLKFGKFEIPVGYVISILISVLSWYILWR